VELHKRTLELSELSLIGPRSRKVVAAATDHAPLALAEEENANRRASVDDVPVVTVATEDGGVDVLFASESLATVTGALARHGAHPVSEAASEILRVERGRPRYGVDLDDSVIPQEAGLNARAVSFTKGCYVGQETVARLHYRGKPNRHLRGLVLDGPAAPGEQLRLGERVVGQLGSTVVSPRLGPIALALVRREAEPGSSVAVGSSGATATVTALPFST
jgi:folate-binding protein YgfZ